ncbi:hypothetical protein AVEN_248029-1 [Araneus ventricosus]|uniref:Uncharacterized protein n=1 Tax=Araneus ventricosus TaxID=182803 RepID=A0A4Y2JK03_ARAVE|nr:hypothetical protein AVEN_248029-1 [Araneus ventricosus]
MKSVYFHYGYQNSATYQILERLELQCHKGENISSFRIAGVVKSSFSGPLQVARVWFLQVPPVEFSVNLQFQKCLSNTTIRLHLLQRSLNQFSEEAVVIFRSHTLRKLLQLHLKIKLIFNLNRWLGGKQMTPWLSLHTSLK